MAGRPTKDFDLKTFQDLVGIGCTQKEICWFFRDETGKSANIDTLSRWCVRTFGMNFHDYFEQNGCMMLKIRLRRNQMKLSETNAGMAIFLGKQILGQSDNPIADQEKLDDDGFIKALSGSAAEDWAEDDE